MTRQNRLTRRQFTAAGIGLATEFLARNTSTAQAAQPSDNDSIISIEQKGVLIPECTLPGETRADGVVPRHANALQLSRDRWLVIYSTHGYRGVDDERSIVYQVRSNASDGTVLKEGFLSRAVADWRPEGVDLSKLGPNRTLFKQHGHMVAFGVPKGATIEGRPVPHAGLFVAKWRTLGRVLDHARDYLLHRTSEETPGRTTQGVECVQFRLNRAGDDIEIVEPTKLLRQSGFDEGPQFCSAADAGWMNQSFTPSVPFNRDCSEWADCNHFDGGRVAAMKYRYNAKRGLYEWVELGPFLSGPDDWLMEASLARAGDAWVIAARRRTKSGVAWARVSDPFGPLPSPTLPEEPHCNAPLTVFTSGDGVLRLFTGDGQQSPHRNARDPLYCWDVDPTRGFACTNRRTLFDSVQAGLPIRREVHAKIDFCELFPPQGSMQLVVYGVSTRGYNHTYENRPDIPPINAAEKAAAGIYYSRITYREAVQRPWQLS